MDVSVTVHSLAGDILFESAKVSSIHELADASAVQLKAKKCRMVSADGKIVSELSHLHDRHERLTAVAQNVSPLLQLVGLQNEEGDLQVDASQHLPLEQLEQISLEIATALAHVACWFGGPQHIFGSPSIPWTFGHLLSAPRGSFSVDMSGGCPHLRVGPSTPVVHLGAQVVFYITDGWQPRSGCFHSDPRPDAVQEVKSIKATRELTVDDIIQIRSAHQDHCNKNKSKLLEKHGKGADAVLATMRLVRYTMETVFFELGHRALNELGEDF